MLCLKCGQLMEAEDYSAPKGSYNWYCSCCDGTWDEYIAARRRGLGVTHEKVEGMIKNDLYT